MYTVVQQTLTRQQVLSLDQLLRLSRAQDSGPLRSERTGLFSSAPRKKPFLQPQGTSYGSGILLSVELRGQVDASLEAIFRLIVLALGVLRCRDDVERPQRPNGVDAIALGTAGIPKDGLSELFGLVKFFLKGKIPGKFEEDFLTPWI